MKIIKTLYIISLILSVGASSFAGFTGSGSTQSATAVTVAEAKQLMDDSWICLEGNIVKQLGGKYYQFQDKTGDITIEIKPYLLSNLTVTPEQTVRIYGEIDQDVYGTKVEVKKIEIVSQQQQAVTTALPQQQGTNTPITSQK